MEIADLKYHAFVQQGFECWSLLFTNDSKTHQKHFNGKHGMENITALLHYTRLTALFPGLPG